MCLFLFIMNGYDGFILVYEIEYGRVHKIVDIKIPLRGSLTL